MLKKVLVLSMFVYAGFPAFATTDIQPNGNLSGGNTAANCTQPVLSTYSGSTNFEAKWRANTVPLRWYNNNTLIENTESAANTCNYDGVLNIPATAPNRIGYDFAGWRVRPTYDFSTIPTATNGTERWGIGIDEDDSDFCVNAPIGDDIVVSHNCYEPEYRDLSRNEWKVQFSFGTIYGAGYCSGKSGEPNGYTWNNDSSNWLSTYDQLTTASGEKKHCWCQVTGYKPNGSNTLYGPSSNYLISNWVFISTRNSVSLCSQECVHACAHRSLNYSGARSALFGITQ